MELPITSATNSVINLITVTSVVIGICIVISQKIKLRKQKLREKQRQVIEEKTKQFLEIET